MLQAGGPHPESEIFQTLVLQRFDSNNHTRRVHSLSPQRGEGSRVRGGSVVAHSKALTAPVSPSAFICVHPWLKWVSVLPRPLN